MSMPQTYEGPLERDGKPPGCCNCHFWKAPSSKVAAEGECRRQPPRSSATDRKWPSSLITDWCGEHREMQFRRF